MVNLFEMQRDFLDRFTECGSKKVFDYYLEIDKIFNSAGPFFIDKRTPIYKKIQFQENEYEMKYGENHERERKM